MGKYFYHRLDRLIKLKDQEQVTRDSSYLKEQDKEQEKDRSTGTASISRSRTRTTGKAPTSRSSSLWCLINIPPRRQEQSHKAGSRTSTLQRSRNRSIQRKMSSSRAPHPGTAQWRGSSRAGRT